MRSGAESFHNDDRFERRRTTMTDKSIPAGNALINGAKVLGELGVLPGASLLIDGEVKSGTVHAVGGVLAGLVLGPIGWFAIAADSFSKSVSGRHIHEHFFERKIAD